MIIDERHQLAFVHIPKCAGTSIRSLLQEFDRNSGFFSDKVSEHPDLGMIDYVHIPLFILERYFPKDFCSIKKFSSFAVVRDPYSRFASSLVQRIKMYAEKPFLEMSNSELAAQIDLCIEFLENNDEEEKLLPADFIHFQRQCDFLYFKSDLIVKNIYVSEDIDQLVKVLREKIGSEFEKGMKTDNHKLNQSYVYRNIFFRIILSNLTPNIFKVSRFFPSAFVAEVKNFVYMQGSQNIQKVFFDNKVKKFIERYYCSDISLYEKVKKGEI